jgi:hypothetical protein
MMAQYARCAGILIVRQPFMTGCVLFDICAFVASTRGQVLDMEKKRCMHTLQILSQVLQEMQI